MKRKYREAMRAADALKHYDDAAIRRTLFPRAPTEPATVEPWRPMMTEQERRQHEQYVLDNNLPF